MRSTVSDLGTVVKTARLNRQFTQEQLAEKTGVGLRHIMAIENEGKHPSYEVLCSLIQVLDIPADLIFRPKAAKHTIEQEQFIRGYLSCSAHEQKIINATVHSLLCALRDDKDGVIFNIHAIREKFQHRCCKGVFSVLPRQK